MLLFNKKITASQACQRNLVTEVFPNETFQKETEARLLQYAKLPKVVSIISRGCQCKNQAVPIWVAQASYIYTLCISTMTKFVLNQQWMALKMCLKFPN